MNSLKNAIVYRLEKSGMGEVEAVVLEDDVVVFVVCGSLNILYNGVKTAIPQQNILLLNKGLHQVEFCDCSAVVFRLPISDIEQIVCYLSTNYNVSLISNHNCEYCRFRNFFSASSTAVLAEFFSSVNRLLSIPGFGEQAQKLKLVELIYLILSSSNECLKSRLIRVIASHNNCFTQTIYNNIFKITQTAEMAQRCNLSVTNFRRKFSSQFNTSPCKWNISQRLERAQALLLISDYNISEIASLCAYTNISHFSKSFKQHFSTTPTQFRKLHRKK